MVTRSRRIQVSKYIKSANILLNEASQPKSAPNKFEVETIPLPNEDGFSAIAFALPDVLKQWGGKIREISLDSTCRPLSDMYLYIFTDVDPPGRRTDQTMRSLHFWAKSLAVDVLLDIY